MLLSNNIRQPQLQGAGTATLLMAAIPGVARMREIPTRHSTTTDAGHGGVLSGEYKHTSDAHEKCV